MNKSISVVIPAFNSEASLPVLIKKLHPVLETITDEFEVIIVDDASIDATWKTICSLCESYSWIRGIQLMRNSGQANATLCGLRHAKNNIVITMDDDLQHSPDQIHLLLAALLENPHMDCVFGVFKEKYHSFYRNAGSRLINLINQATFKLPKGTTSSGFRVMHQRLAKELSRRESANPSILVLVMNCTQNVISVPIIHNPRFSGKSNYTLAKQARLALDNICNSTMFPLRFVSGTGIGLCIISAMMSVYYLIRFFSGTISIQGWTTLVLLIMLFSGMILLSLGIIGEYLVRVLREVSYSPPYLIRNRINMSDE